MVGPGVGMWGEWWGYREERLASRRTVGLPCQQDWQRKSSLEQMASTAWGWVYRRHQRDFYRAAPGNLIVGRVV